MAYREVSSRPTVVVTARSFGSGDADPASLLEEAGLEVVRADPVHDLGALVDPLSEAVAWIAGTSPVADTHLSAAPSLRVLAHYGIGYDSVDLAAAARRSVIVTNTPGANVEAVADHTVGLVLAVLRHFVEGNRAARNGSHPTLRGYELGAPTVGVVGFGRIGRAVALRLSGGFGSRVVAYDPFIPPELIRETPGVEVAADLRELASLADVLSLHMPGGAGPVVDADLVEVMKPGAVLVNTARGDLLDEEQVAATLHDGRLGAAAVDVLASEPAFASPLLDAPNTLVTPHVAAQTTEAIDRMGLWAVREVIRVLGGESPLYPVPLPRGQEV
jgi:D-3-phosphoglycerate dehydrogenase / 2-oxoglutarate reductase